MYAARGFLRPVWVTAQNTLKYSTEVPVVPRKKRRLLAAIGKGIGSVAIAVPAVGGVYYALSDDITKRQTRVTIEGIGRLFR